MLEGVRLSQIRSNDYGNRLVLLTKLMSQYSEQLKANQDEEELQTNIRRYNNLQREMEQIENLALGFNSEFKNREMECDLILDDLHKQYAEFIKALEKSNNEYEHLMMKMWRETIKSKKIKDEQYKKDKSAKSGNNKNLMFLASEILKKDRTINCKGKDIKIIQRELAGLENFLKEQQKQQKLDIQAHTFVQEQSRCQNEEPLMQSKKTEDPKTNEWTFLLQKSKNRLFVLIKEQKIKLEGTAAELFGILDELVKKMERLKGNQ